MLKRSIFLFLVILSGCGNPPEPKDKSVISDINRKPKVSKVKPEASFWTIKSFSAKEGETEGKKYVKFVSEGNYSDTTQTGKYLFAEVYVDKKNAGIFLHKLKKSNAAEKFSEPVQIIMTNASGTELQMTSSRRWNSSGGILIENNNNDYSQLRIFLLQNTGTVNVVVNDSKSSTYNFTMNLSGFSESFGKL